MLLEIVFWAPPSLIYSRLASWTDDYRLISWVSCCWSQVRVLFIYMVWSLSIYIFRLSELMVSWNPPFSADLGEVLNLDQVYRVKGKGSHLESFKHFKSGHEPCSIVRVDIRRQIWYFRNSELPGQSTYFLEIQTFN